ncbi:MAG: NUDIX domain-containing protein [Succinivibrionaceae bacterium]|nr:NUDIX domain-containing protein [Succinivibrionaceae bacterium]
MAAEEMVPVYDGHNEFLRLVPRSQMRRERLPHRATYIAFMDTRGSFLVEVRTMSKDYAPGMLDACVGGVVSAEDHDPLEGARRELMEEIGVDAGAVAFHELGHMRLDLDNWGYSYGYLYLAVGDPVTVRQPSEVSGIMYLTLSEMERLRGCFTGDSYSAFLEIVRRSRERGLM